MAILQRKFAAHLSENARSRLNAIRPYPPIDTLRNPLTRALARKISHADWEKTLDDIDFPYAMTDISVAGVRCVDFATQRTDRQKPLILYLHGGGFVSGSPRINASSVLPACELTGCSALGVDYSLTPEAPYPCALEEIERVYLALIEDGRPSDRIFVLGDSAGGNLALASALRWRNKQLPLPAALILLSPSVDGTRSSDTVHTLRKYDPLIRATGSVSIASVYKLYAPKTDIRHPDISPLFGDFRNLPPVLVHVGSREMLLGEAARLAEYVRRAGGDARLRVFDGMFHLFHMHWSFPETREAYKDIAAFIAELSQNS